MNRATLADVTCCATIAYNERGNVFCRRRAKWLVVYTKGGCGWLGIDLPTCSRHIGRFRRMFVEVRAIAGAAMSAATRRKYGFRRELQAVA